MNTKIFNLIKENLDIAFNLAKYSKICADITDWDFLRIGGHGVSDGERWIGKIAVSKVYDRALTAQEMQQNYQQYKTRFNLS